MDSYWDQFLRSLPKGADRPSHYYEAFHFGTTAESAKELAALVLDGTKTATGSLQWVYEAEGKHLPKAGDFSIVADRSGNPICIIQTTGVDIIPFDQADARLAYDGGEGDRSLDTWRAIYWDYIVSECRRIGRIPAPQIPLVAEHFCVVFSEPPEIS